MATISSIYTDPSDTFVWWIEGDRIAIATTEGDGTTDETSEGDLKTVQLGSTVSLQSTGDPLPNNLLNEALDSSEVEVDVDEGGQFSAGQIIQIDSELMRIVSIATNTLTVTRGYNNTTAAAHDNTSIISTINVISDGIIISYKGDPDRIDAITDTLDLDNSLQPLLIDYVKGHALLDAAAKDANPATAQIKIALAQTFLNNYKEGLRKFGMKKVDKIGGTRAVVPANLV